MRAAGRGRVVNVSSMGGRMTLPGGGVYHASKYAVEALSDALRFETRGFGIAVSVVAPGPVRTAFADAATAGRRVTGRTPRSCAASPTAMPPPTRPEGPRPAASPRPWPTVIVTVLESAGRGRATRSASSSRETDGARRVLPTAVWDALLRRQYPTP